MASSSMPQGADDNFLGPAMEENLASALSSSAQFNQQTEERVKEMKFLVLKAFEGEDRADAAQSQHAGHEQQYSRDITTKIVSLVEGRAEAVDQFKKAQEFAEFTLTNLKKRLAMLRV